MWTISLSLAHLTWPLAVVWAVRHVTQAWTAHYTTAAIAPEPVVAVPDDLVALAMQYPDPWAQEDMLKVIRERYDDLRDWNRVRSAMNIGVIPSQP